MKRHSCTMARIRRACEFARPIHLSFGPRCLDLLVAGQLSGRAHRDVRSQCHFHLRASAR